MTDDTMAFLNRIHTRGQRRGPAEGARRGDVAAAHDYDVENLVGTARYERSEARTPIFFVETTLVSPS